jgi:hypothetical protein
MILYGVRGIVGAIPLAFKQQGFITTEVPNIHQLKP